MTQAQSNTEPLWLVRVHQEQRLMKRLEEKHEMFELIKKAQESPCVRK